jgi:hypothetical protein
MHTHIVERRGGFEAERTERGGVYIYAYNHQGARTIQRATSWNDVRDNNDYMPVLTVALSTLQGLADLRDACSALLEQTDQEDAEEALASGDFERDEES